MNLDEERDILRDLPKSKTNPRSIPVNSYKHHVYIESDVYNKRCSENLVSIQPFHRHVSRFKECLYKYDDDDEGYIHMIRKMTLTLKVVKDLQ